MNEEKLNILLKKIYADHPKQSEYSVTICGTKSEIKKKKTLLTKLLKASGLYS
jgi:DNA-binding HxlR family transcriptional regulator